MKAALLVVLAVCVAHALAVGDDEAPTYACHRPPQKGATYVAKECTMVHYPVALAEGAAMKDVDDEDHLEDLLDDFEDSLTLDELKGMFSWSGKVDLMEERPQCVQARKALSCALSMPMCESTAGAPKALPLCRRTCDSFVDACVLPSLRAKVKAKHCVTRPAQGCTHLPLFAARAGALKGVPEMFTEGTMTGGVSDLVIKSLDGHAKIWAKDSTAIHFKLDNVKVELSVDYWADAAGVFESGGQVEVYVPQMTVDAVVDVTFNTNTDEWEFTARSIEATHELDFRMHEDGDTKSFLTGVASFFKWLFFDNDDFSSTVRSGVEYLITSKMSQKVAVFLANNKDAQFSFDGSIKLINHAEMDAHSFTLRAEADAETSLLQVDELALGTRTLPLRNAETGEVHLVEVFQ